MIKRILLVTRQAGSVAAFEPILGCLEENKWAYDILAFGKSRVEWKKLGRNFDSNKIPTINDLKDYSLVLTGTSEKVKKDAYFWKLAKGKGVPSVAFVDSWVNYSERFTVKNNFDRTPDYIGLIDDLMYSRMIEKGAPVEKLVVLGNPRFDSILQKYTSYSNKISNTNSINIIFFTDPVTGTKADNDEYGSKTVVKSVLKQILSQSKHSNRKITITIKPHPRESSDDYKDLIENVNQKGLVTISNETPLKLMRKADIVMGMNTILLIDSSLLGIPTYSFQPGRNEATNDITDGRNIHVITSWEGVEFEISKLFLKESARKKNTFKESYNAQRFVKFINSIFKDSYP